MAEGNRVRGAKPILSGALAICALSLASCAAVVGDRVESALIDAGVPPAMAECMAPQWADRLSVSQIRGIQRFAKDVRADGRSLTAGRLLEHARTWNDPEALMVVASSAAQCTFS
ncbi:hypothetical protein ABVV53_00645 [Novosphingobium sp. RD2P27]|uniref:DUF732 domain-containing protein n=1 Tax=Novosphingobium kalidii TaxID=3230299 RepID=A0ABV2CWK3_9SPHN